MLYSGSDTEKMNEMYWKTVTWKQWKQLWKAVKSDKPFLLPFSNWIWPFRQRSRKNNSKNGANGNSILWLDIFASHWHIPVLKSGKKFRFEVKISYHAAVLSEFSVNCLSIWFAVYILYNFNSSYIYYICILSWHMSSNKACRLLYMTVRLN